MVAIGGNLVSVTYMHRRTSVVLKTKLATEGLYKSSYYDQQKGLRGFHGYYNKASSVL